MLVIGVATRRCVVALVAREFGARVTLLGGGAANGAAATPCTRAICAACTTRRRTLVEAHP